MENEKVAEAPASEMPDAGAPEEGNTSFVSTSQLGDGRCPLRGYPNRFLLDERCPEETEVLWTAGGKLIVREGGTEDMRIPCPMVRKDSDCRGCLDNMTREREAGMDTKARPTHSSGSGLLKGRRRRQGGKSKKTRKQEIEDLTEQLKGDK